MAQQKEYKAREGELTKVRRVAEKAQKDAARIEKVVQKQRRESTLKKWKENENGGQRSKILQLMVDGKHPSRKIQLSMPWQKKVNQKIAKDKLDAKKRRENVGYLFQAFLPS